MWVNRTKELETVSKISGFRADQQKTYYSGENLRIIFEKKNGPFPASIFEGWYRRLNSRPIILIFMSTTYAENDRDWKI